MENIVERLDEKKAQIERIKKNCKNLENNDITLRLMENANRNEHFTKSDRPTDMKMSINQILLNQRGNTIINQRMSARYCPISSVYRGTSREIYEDVLVSKIEQLRKSAEMHRLECDSNSEYSVGTIFLTDKKRRKARLEEADIHDADADYYQGLLQESFLTPYEDRQPREAPKIVTEKMWEKYLLKD